MSYLALYRKYRPNNFSDLVGQNEISHIIKNEILNNRISHAYLFSGPRGTGKTSTAKIIAKMINCSNLSVEGIPCGKCDSCINFDGSSDVVEIDAASNNGVDEIRELRDKVNLVPTYGKYKIYIIDEVHMLTTQAFNALLKTLEEPPSHVVFILATTEFYKIPVTVISRCQKFQFFKFSNEEIVSRLAFIAKNENINVDNDVLEEIARLSDGGMRDAINMLDQLSSYNDSSIDINDVYLLNGIFSFKDYYNLIKSIYSKNTVDIIEFIENIDKSGKSYSRFLADFIDFMKDILIFKNNSNFLLNNDEKIEVYSKVVKLFDDNQIYKFIMSLNDLSNKIKNSSFSKILIVTEMINISNLLTVNFKNVNNKIVKSDNKSMVNNSISVNINGTDGFVLSDKLKFIRINNAFSSASKKFKDNFISKWDNLLEILANNSNYATISLMMSDVETLVVGKNNVIFMAPYDSLLDRLIFNTKLIEKLLLEVYNIDYKCVFLLNDEWEYEKKKYIDNIKNGKVYQYIKEEDDSTDSDLNSDDSDINKIVSILGDEVISYE